MVFDSLPKEIKDFFPADLQQEIQRHWCHYPDEVQFFDEKLLGKDALETLRKMHVRGGGELHADINIAASFVLLEKAFADKEPKRAAVWIGSLIHTVGDDDCHIGQMSWAWDLSRYKIKRAEGYGELSMMDSSEIGRNTLKKKMEGFKPQSLGDNPNEVVKKLLVLAYTSMDDSAQKACRISSTFNYGDKGAPLRGRDRRDGRTGRGRAQEALDAIVTAWEMAEQNKTVELTDNLVKQSRKTIDDYVATKPLSHDSVYDGTLQSHPTGPAVGVLIEPSTCMGNSRFGFTACVYLAQAMRTLQEAKVAYLPLDIRAVEKDGLPAGDKMPVLVVVSGGFNVSDFGLTSFAKYVKGGGKLIWIAGLDRGFLGKLSSSLKDADRKLLPVGIDYEDAKHEGAAAIAKVSVKFLGDFGDVLGKDQRKFVNNPNLGGWDTPHCNVQIVSNDPDVKPLAEVTDGQKSMTIAAALMEDGKAKHVFLPQYLMVPFVLSDDQTIDFGRPLFDSTGKKILLTSVRMLAPELMPKEK